MTQRRLRIAMFVSNYFPHPGGLEVMVWNLARGLARRHDVVVVTSAFGGVQGVSREDAMVVHRLPALHVTERFGVPYPIPTGVGLGAARAAVRQVDVVQSHGALYLQTILARAVARQSKAPLVITEHVGFVTYPSRLLNTVQRLAWSAIGFPLVRGASEVVTYNARVHAQLERDSGREVRYIGNGVDFERFRPQPPEGRRATRRAFGLPEDGTLVLFAGRESQKKNLDVLLHAPRESYTLVVCGAVRNLTGPGLVDLGVVPYSRMADLFGCVDLMVHPASGEGFPLAVQESVAAGVPIVLLWDEGYARWMPRDLVGACDSVGEIVPCLASLASDPAGREAMARAGRAWALEHWSWDATVAAYERVYYEAIDGTTHD